MQFLQTQGPSGPGWNGGMSLRFCAPKMLCPDQGVTLVMGSGADSPCQGEMARRTRGGRVGDYEHEVLIWSRPRWRFAFFFAMEKEGRRLQAAKYPCGRKQRRVREAAPYRGAEISKGGRCTPQCGFSCPFGAIHLQPLPYKKWAKKVERNGRRRNSLHFVFTFAS